MLHKLLVLLIILNINLLSSTSYAENQNEVQSEVQNKEDIQFVVTPIKKRGQKWRIGYIESGARDTYYASLVATLQSLMKLDWLPQMSLPASKDEKATSELWLWLATQVDSQYIEFVKEAYWTKVSDPTEAAKASTDLLAFQKAQSIDLVICMGTDAGKLIRAMSEAKKEAYTIQTVIASVTDAIAANIIDSAENSGYDHLLAKVDPERFKTQIEVFYNIFHFKKLGIVYDPEKSSIFGLQTIEDAIKGKNVTLMPCYIKQRTLEELTIAEQELATCYETLAPKIDAMYVTNTPGLTIKNMPNLIAPLNQNHIPSFVQLGTQFVENGMLMTLSTAGYGYLGDYYAETIAKVFNGAKLGQLVQILPSRLTFTINLETARILGVKLPIEAIGAADELYGLSEEDF